MIALPESELSLFFKALRFAAYKHRNQRRKDSQSSPYINHPIAVAETLWRVGHVREITTLVAAVLHDTIEDTDTTPEEVKAEFGDAVLSLVLEVTDDKRLPKAERKRLQIETAPHKSPGAKQIKLADKITNVYDVIHTPPLTWSLQRKWDYLDWTEKVVNGLRGQNRELEELYDQTLAEGRQILGRQKEGGIFRLLFNR